MTLCASLHVRQRAGRQRPGTAPLDDVSTLRCNGWGGWAGNVAIPFYLFSVNMTASNISSGQERVMYLPPLPLKGTGLHRFVFTLFSHRQEVCEVPLPAGTW